ncbi:2-oxoisovalerate dehydrogenase [bacterium]|nr:2-oxoisovalerate dehydrogenase [bacterium]
MSQRGQNRNKAKKTDSEIIFLVEESPEGGYDARALGYSIFTQGESLSDLREALKDAVRCHFNKNERPRLIRLHLVKEEVIPA